MNNLKTLEMMAKPTRYREPTEYELSYLCMVLLGEIKERGKSIKSTIRKGSGAAASRKNAAKTR